MSKRQFKSQASSGRLGGFGGGFGSSAFGSGSSSVLSYVQEPPDYSAVSDSNVVVAFKNLSKKDSTTKAKALEDLLSFLAGTKSEVEDAVIEAWVKQYPRLSIDNSRRVRQLAHQHTGLLSVQCGKRIAKQLPIIAGPWLAGSFDSDRSVSKAAEHALGTVFASPEKIRGLRKTFQEPILEYSRDAVLNETVGTLSDERSISADDAKATYARVVSTSISVITSLLDSLPTEDVAKQAHTYQAVLGDKRLWDFVTHEDASVRKAMHQLVLLCLHKDSELVESNLGTASTAYIYKGLASDQTGSSLSFIHTLDALATKFPSVWTTAYSGKKPALSRLRQGLKSGAHAGPASYWEIMSSLLRKLPAEVLPKSYSEISDLLLAARDGVSRKEERFNASASWPVYFTLVNLVTVSTPSEDVATLLEAFVMPCISQYIYPSDESARWTISGPKPAALVSQVGVIKRLPPLLEDKWPGLAQSLIELAKLSQPEQSKDFEKSQKHVATAGERWADLQREFFTSRYCFPQSLSAVFVQVNTDILRESIALLESRNGKPWGAAAIIEQQLRTCAAHLLKNQTYHQVLVDFMARALPSLFLSPSQRHLIRCLYALQDDQSFAELLETTLQRVLEADGDAAMNGLHTLFPSNAPQSAVVIAQKSTELQAFLRRRVSGNEESARTLFAHLLKLGAVSKDAADTVLSELTDTLSLDNPGLQAGLSAIEQLTRTNNSTVRAFMSTTGGEDMLPRVMRLRDSPSDSVADTASALATLLTSSFAEASAETKYSLISQNLEKVSQSSLPIDSVLHLADKVVADEADATVFKSALPSIETWEQATLAAMATPKSSLALLSPLGGAINVLQVAKTVETSEYDDDGLSQALRIAIFYAHVLKTVSAATVPEHSRVLALLNICILLCEDGTSIAGANNLWQADRSRDLEHDVMAFVSNANHVIRAYWEAVATSADDVHHASIFSAFDELILDYKGTPMEYYGALAAAKAHENALELHGCSSAQSKASEDELRAKRGAKDFLALTSYIVGFAQALTGSQLLSRMCNEAVADLTQQELTTDESKELQKLVLLNIILHTQGDLVETIAKPRLIFLVKHIVPWLGSDASLILKAEVCKALTSLLPAMADMYGEHWAQIVSSLVSFWSTATNAPPDTETVESSILVKHSTLKLHAALRKLSVGDEPNDDLVEALKDNQDTLQDGLISLLKAATSVPDEEHQPMMTTNELLSRQLMQSTAKSVGNAEDLFPLLYAPSQAVLGAAFELLHKQIPKAQEQISLDAALENRKAALPDELLSLIMQAPDLNALDDDAFELTVPLALQGYLHGWRLVFDHFHGSSFRVKGDYVEQLKDGGYLGDLLDMAFDMLRLSSGRPVEASNFSLQSYSPGLEANPQKETQALLTHLYYLSLLHLPSLVKNYLNNEIKSRQAPRTIEAWTAKYISPLIIEQSLTEVSQWAEKTVSEDPDYEAMTVKVSMRGKEVHVAYQIDEQTMAMKIVLPEAYPLQIARPEGVNRVAVTEQKWRAWLMNCQGTITFSNGSIIDALSSWRKNVAGALKGHVECAICYSIINEARELPTKRCQTCKNMFHSACLFKWFRSSNSSTCPLCRQPYNYN
ncbi:Putative E3 ubiquitin-protein ligase listerin [Septoria linicola]|uniref:E3 ubiquitin-protein ligase listerin n=1 Tax=Septoria linicola TaxID=215465 RepID=A0A9Q9AW81_9PEZI|nr:putative E3 ubiquitin-protein ligase listerin [Septoria linicola]USW56285.1 Putative E3 ubiquitin-protein ligase listerin [Septoria linicola]